MIISDRCCLCNGNLNSGDVNGICRTCASNQANAPTIEPKRGEWKLDHMTGEREHYASCSVCGEIKFFKSLTEYNFCPNCGADMREENK